MRWYGMHDLELRRRMKDENPNVYIGDSLLVPSSREN
jgi:hypothetical protein